MNIESFENAIVDKLNSDINEVAVKAMPDRESARMITHPVGLVAVCYGSSKYSDSLYEDLIMQDRYLFWNVFCSVKGLRDNNGAYSILEKIRKSLSGFTFEDSKKMMPVSDDLIEENNGVWHYLLVFKVKVQEIEEGYING